MVGIAPRTADEGGLSSDLAASAALIGRTHMQRLTNEDARAITARRNFPLHLQAAEARRNASLVRFEKAGPEFVIESHTRGAQRHPALAAFKGGFVAAWTDDVLPPGDIGGPDVRAKAFTAAGDPVLSEFCVNTETIDHQRDPKIAGLPNGGFVVVWQDFSGRGGDPCCGGIKASCSEGTAGLLMTNSW
jgi:hypothetical protein